MRNHFIILECVEIAKKFTKVLTESPKRIRTKIVRSSKPTYEQKLAELQVGYDDHLASIGKKETISVTQIAELNNKNKMPTMIKHCVVAVMPQLKSEGKENAFIGAHNICVWSFNRHGLVTKEGKSTSRGQLRERHHKSKSDEGAAKKTSTYARLYNSIFGRG